MHNQLYYETIIKSQRYADDLRVLKHGFKSFSQNDEDGIIQEIFSRIGYINRIFVEFGIQNGIECNTHLLLISGWSGLWIDGDAKFCTEAKHSFSHYVDQQLSIENSFITAENINELIEKNNITGEIDLLSIDIDGNDLWVWKAINIINPRVVVIEYNSTFRPPLSISLPYEVDRVWDKTSNLGSSLSALVGVAGEKGYSLVGCNFTGINAFFVRDDLLANNFCAPYTAENHFEPPRYGFKFLSGHEPACGKWEKI